MIEACEEIFMFNVEEELKKLPRKPGVYIMRDDKDVILYVGKAINLHNRVRSYFVKISAEARPLTRWCR